MNYLKWDYDSVDITAVVLLAQKENADIFFERIYPLWSDAIIVTEDGFYPENEMLREKIKIELQTNHNLPVIVFSLSSYFKMNIISKNILNFEELIKKDSYRFTKIKPFNWTDFGIANLLFQFSSLNSSLLRPSSDEEIWYKNVNPESLNWCHKLIL